MGTIGIVYQRLDIKPFKMGFKYIILVVFLTSCNLASLDTKKSGINKKSESIDESKKNGVYQFRVNVNKPIVSIAKNLKDTIKEIWVESMWMYSDNGSILKDTTNQLLILFGSSSRKYNADILLRRKNDYLGWNGVFFGTYSNPQDTIYVISAATGNEKPLDTIFVGK
jgi:hypothetical protein